MYNITVKYGAQKKTIRAESIKDAYNKLSNIMNLPESSTILVNGKPSSFSHVLSDGDFVDFVKPAGRKGSNYLNEKTIKSINLRPIDKDFFKMSIAEWNSEFGLGFEIVKDKDVVYLVKRDNIRLKFLYKKPIDDSVSFIKFIETSIMEAGSWDKVPTSIKDMIEEIDLLNEGILTRETIEE